MRDVLSPEIQGGGHAQGISSCELEAFGVHQSTEQLLVKLLATGVFWQHELVKARVRLRQCVALHVRLGDRKRWIETVHRHFRSARDKLEKDASGS